MFSLIYICIYEYIKTFWNDQIIIGLDILFSSKLILLSSSNLDFVFKFFIVLFFVFNY